MPKFTYHEGSCGSKCTSKTLIQQAPKFPSIHLPLTKKSQNTYRPHKFSTPRFIQRIIPALIHGGPHRPNSLRQCHDKLKIPGTGQTKNYNNTRVPPNPPSNDQSHTHHPINISPVNRPSQKSKSKARRAPETAGLSSATFPGPQRSPARHPITSQAPVTTHGVHRG